MKRIARHPRRQARRERALARFSTMSFLAWSLDKYGDNEVVSAERSRNDRDEYAAYAARKEAELASLKA